MALHANFPKSPHQILNPEIAGLVCIVTKEKAYEVSIKMKGFMGIFERSFVKFWEEKIKK